MAAESRARDLAVERYTLERRLSEEPFVFEFFQAVRLIERLCRDRVPVGRFAKPQDEAVRLTVNSSLAFPASEIQAFTWREGQPPLLQVNFMGLTGPQGALPLYYTQFVAERAKLKDTAAQDFLDIFNHRMISLFYGAWEKYHFTVEHERSGRDPFAHHLLDFVGLGTAGLENRQAVPDFSPAYYAGLLGQYPRCATNLEQLLEDYFEVPVAVEQFAGAWYRIARSMQTCLEAGESEVEWLAVGAVVGDEVWDEQARIRVRLGPLTLEQYLDFLPTGTAWPALRALVRFFTRDELDCEVLLVLRQPEVPFCELGREDDAGPRLGWLSWSHAGPMNRDPADTMLEL